jgi:hypothetical protein
LAFVPLVLRDLSQDASVAIAIAIAIGLNIALVFGDRKRLEAVGININAAWVLLVPGYLILRTMRTNTTWAIPVVWFITFFASLAVPVLIPAAAGPVTMDSHKVEQQLTQSIQQQDGVRPTVTCPHNPRVAIDDTFTCTARDRTGSVHVLVTVTDSDGRYSWQLTQ